MNRNPEHLQRGPVDFVLFGIVFIGFVIAASGLVTASIPAAVTGFICMAVGLSGFWIKGELFS